MDEIIIKRKGVNLIIIDEADITPTPLPPTPSETGTPMPTPTETLTGTPVVTPTGTTSETPSPTPTESLTGTPVSTPTPTESSTGTPVPSQTPTNSPSPSKPTQNMGKINYSIVNGAVKIEGVDGTNPVIYDNDIFHDTPEGYFIWLKANRKEVNLVGNISTRNMFMPPNPNHTHDEDYNVWVEAIGYANQAGLKNIPTPVKGSGAPLIKPSSGNIDDTQFRTSVGADLIISEARKASAAKPLIIFIGGSITTVADAYLKDKTIVDKVIVMQIDGADPTMHNGTDRWAQEVVIKRMKFVNWAGDLFSWYKPGIPQNLSVNGLPNNPFANWYRNAFYNQAGTAYPHSVGDAPVVLWFFDNSVWKNVVKKTFSGQTVTGDVYDYLLISENDWTKYGQMINTVMLDANSYIPVTTAVTPTPSPSVSSSPQPGITSTPTPSISTSAQTAVTPTPSATKAVVTPPPTMPVSTGNEFSVMAYGARGDGSFDDTQAFKNCFNAAIAARGKVIIPNAPNHYRLTDTILVYNQQSGQTWIDVEAWGWGVGTNTIMYYGPSNRPVFQLIGTKQGMWNGLKVGIANGISGVTIFDLDTRDNADSLTGLTLKNMYFNLGDQANVGVRIGHISGGGGDVSNVQFENIAIYGKQFIRGGVPGQIAYLHEGNNSLSFTWIGGFVAHVDRVYTNKSGAGATRDRGNGACSFYGLGGSGNNIDFEISYESQYLITGGRWEHGNQFLVVPSAGAYSSITLQGIPINEYMNNADIIEIRQAISLQLDNVQIMRPERATLFNNIIGLYSNGRNASISVRGGNYGSNVLYNKVGSTLWNITVDGVSKADGPWSNGFFPNEFGARK